MPRGSKKKPNPLEDALGNVTSEVTSIVTLDDLPAQKINGQPNPEYYAQLLDLGNRTYFQQILIDGGASQFNLAQFQKGVVDAAKMAGLTEREVVDRRTEAQRAEDVVKAIMSDPEEAFGISDEDLRALDRTISTKEERMDAADKECGEFLDDFLHREDVNPRAPKAWRRRIHRILRLRDRARNPLPKCNRWPNQHQNKSLIKGSLEAAHPLRFMIYVGRAGSEMADEHKAKNVADPADLVFDVSRHHAVFASTYWVHRRGIAIILNEEHEREFEWGVIPCSGSIQIMAVGHGKPLDVETLVAMANGSRKRLGDIVVGDRVIGHSGKSRNVSETFDQGYLPTIKIMTSSGREVVSALDHPFLTPCGWKKARDLAVGEHLALKSGWETPDYSAIPEESRLAGYFVGDGCTVELQTTIKASITCADPEQGDEIHRCADRMGFAVKEYPSQSKAKEYCFSTGKSSPRDWLRKTGMAGKNSHTKRVPSFVFESDDACVAEFVAAYFECDGTVSKSDRSKNDLIVEFNSVSRELLADVQHLLIRLGIKSRLAQKKGRYKGKVHHSWRLSVSTANETAKFFDRIPIKGEKSHKLRRLVRPRNRFEAQYEADEIVSIEDNGLRPCKCLTVDEDHTFLANDFVVHNTELAVHIAGLEMGLRPRCMAYYVHAKFDKAKQNVGAIKRFVDKNDGIGKRYLSLFPVELSKTNNDASHIRIKTKNPPKSPTWTAAGVDTAELGGDSDFQIWDDVVPQSDADQPTERERRFRVLRGTFLTRQRGRNTFVLVIGTLWHYGDALMQMIKLAKDAKRTNAQHGLAFGVKVQRCGGPKGNAHTKAWEPLWPKLQGVFQLKQQYGKLGPSLYAAAMMADPVADEQRIVKRIRLYDPTSPEHEAFLDSSVKYLSLDPSATKESTSDKAGILYAGKGYVRVIREVDGIQTVDTENRVRFFDCTEIHATQSDLTEYAYMHARAKPVDYVLAEAVSGFKGIIEMFNGLGIDAIPLNPRGKSKETRLRGVAPMLEDSNPALQRAIAEFPAARNDRGELELHPNFRSLAEQIIDFGVCAKDDCLDACSQLLGYLAPELDVGQGIVTQSIHRQEQQVGDPRMIALYKSYDRAQKKANGPPEEQEDEWMKSNWRS